MASLCIDKRIKIGYEHLKALVVGHKCDKTDTRLSAVCNLIPVVDDTVYRVLHLSWGIGLEILSPRRAEMPQYDQNILKFGVSQPSDVGTDVSSNIRMTLLRRIGGERMNNRQFN